MQHECKLIIFDLDGVLLDAKMIHFDALNKALADISPDLVISYEDHLLKYDGLPTKKKLEVLSKETNLFSDYDIFFINQRKQNYTVEMIKQINRDDELVRTIKLLKRKGYFIAVASNSIRNTIEYALIGLGINNLVDYFVGNDDVKNAKPNAEMYLKCMIYFSVSPGETLILEDSEKGRQAVAASGARLCPVNDMSKDVNYERILQYAKNSDIHHKWKDDNLNVLIPMAGYGSRFAEAGYTFPKPLIEINGKPMIQVVVENLALDAHHIFIVQKTHYEKYNLQYLLNLISPGCDVIQVDGVTEGAACTTLLAKELIDNDKALVVANSDQYLEWESSQFMYSMTAGHLDAGIVTFRATHPKWSFARVENGTVVEVAEKKPISDIATTGIYYWKHGSEYVKYAEQMIQKNIRTNGEFYVCPVFNEAIGDGKIVKPFGIDKMWGLGTPEDLETFNGR